MDEAIEEAQLALASGDVPVGAVVVRDEDELRIVPEPSNKL